MIFANSQTYKNIISAMEEALKSASLYRIYAENAEAEQKEYLSAMLFEISKHELEYAKICMKLLNNGDTPSSYVGLMNCLSTADYNAKHTYTRLAREAFKEGFFKIADIFNGISKIELRHNELIRQELEDTPKKEEVPSNDKKNLWMCTNCGNITEGFKLPEKCPICHSEKTRHKLL